MYDIALIEGKMIESLKMVTDLRTIDSHQGEVIGVRDGTMLVNMPAALIEYTGTRVDGERAGDSVRARVKVDFVVYVIGKNLKGAKDVSADVRTILNQVRQKLNGLIYEKVMLLWQSEELTFITQTGICVYQQNYQYTDYLVK